MEIWVSITYRRDVPCVSIDGKVMVAIEKPASHRRTVKPIRVLDVDKWVIVSVGLWRCFPCVACIVVIRTVYSVSPLGLVGGERCLAAQTSSYSAEHAAELHKYGSELR